MTQNNHRLNLNEFNIIEKLGSGSFGKVFKIKCSETGRIYAAKIIKNLTKQTEIDLIREINILASLNHMSIIKFIGYSPIDFTEKFRPVIVTEFVPNSSLSDIIALTKENPNNIFWDNTKKLINIYGIASGMSYLHSHSILHRDLKSDNILEDEFLFPKIADFGFSKQIRESIATQNSGTKGTPAYMAPEAWMSEYRKASDVYSFAMIMYEIFTNEKPFQDLNEFAIIGKIMNKSRPEFKTPIYECFKSLIERCWSENPEDRPTFDQIVEELKNNPSYLIEGVNKEEFFYYVDIVEKYPSKFESNQMIQLKEEFVNDKKFPFTKFSLSRLKYNEVLDFFKDVDEDGSKFFNLPKETKKMLKLLISDRNIEYIEISNENAYKLFQNGSLSSSDFICLLSKFNLIRFEIICPKYCNNSLLQQISKIKREIQTEIIVSLIINDSESDPKINKKAFIYFPFIKKVVINSPINSINSHAFESCIFLTKIVIPPSIASIGNYAFKGCSSLTQIEIPSSVKSIGIYAFSECKSITKISIPSSVTSIGSYAFCEYSSLAEVSLLSPIKSIEEGLFAECSSLVRISVPSSVTKIESNSFFRCSSLTDIFIPSSVVEIKVDAFLGCSLLKKDLDCLSMNQLELLADIDDYKISKFITKGHFASVFKATNKNTGEEAAIKVINK